MKEKKKKMKEIFSYVIGITGPYISNLKWSFDSK